MIIKRKPHLRVTPALATVLVTKLVMLGLQRKALITQMIAAASLIHLLRVVSLMHLDISRNLERALASKRRQPTRRLFRTSTGLYT